MRTIEYGETHGFSRDFKKLLKRFRSLESDLEHAKQFAIGVFHANPRIDTNAVEEIGGFCTDAVRVCKVRKFPCRALVGRGAMSGIRVIYAYFPAESRVDFIEIYFKGDKENEDRKRIKEYLSQRQ